MKLAKSTLLAWVAVSAIAGFLLLTATACKKAVSTGANSSTLTPEQARQQRLDWNLETLVEPYKKAGFADTAWDEPAKRALTAFANLRSERHQL
jgi:hypothetical protein